MNRHALKYVDMYPAPCQPSKSAVWCILVAPVGTLALALPLVVLMLAYFDVLFV